MIPLKLQLKNFLSYGSELSTIDFSLYKMICFSGKNGHGKSALLDAITWAVWGQARKTLGSSKADQGLLRLGQTNMLVCFDFLYNNIQYRIRRELTMRHAKPYAALDFGIIEKNGIIRSLTDKTIRTTQAKIEKTIFLDYDSFCSSTYLRQGNSNEFCKKSPKDRKEILSRILQLQKYETVRRLALDKAKKIATKKENLLSLQQTINTELEKEASVKKEYEFVRTKQKALNSTYLCLITDKKRSLEKIAALQEKKVLAQAEELNAKKIHTNIQKKYLLLKDTLKEWRIFNKKLNQNKNLPLLQEKIAILSTDLEKHNNAQKQDLLLKNNLQKNMHSLEFFILQWKKEYNAKTYQAQLAITKQKLSYQQKNLVYTGLHDKKKLVLKDLEQYKQKIAAIKKEKKSIEKNINLEASTQKKLKKRKLFFYRSTQQYSLLYKQLNNINKKLATLNENDCAPCPLCTQKIPALNKTLIIKTLTHKKSFYNHQITRLKKIIPPLRAIIIKQEQKLEKFDAIIKKHAVLLSQEKEWAESAITQTHNLELINKLIEKSATEQHKESTALAAQEKCLSDLEKNEAIKLKLSDQHKKLIGEKESLLQELKKLNYQEVNHKKIEEEYLEKKALVKQSEEILHKIPLQQERKNKCFSTCAELRLLKKEFRLHSEKAIAINQHITHLASEEKQSALLEKQISMIQQEKESYMQQQGALEQKKEMLEKYLEKNNIITLELKKHGLAHEELTHIAQAMSKDGIQALLIEKILPELEQEANILLAQLTHNQAQIKIESLKDLKSGGTKETLDIIISDSLGLRPYELFSGGETFKIDFSLRIALSKLVARRAGAPLQTLIIDEGFGSQDEESLNLMMEALYKIQNHFEKIIVVSHLPFMKNHFPTHFSIEKGPLGSVVSIIEQG